MMNKTRPSTSEVIADLVQSEDQSGPGLNFAVYADRISPAKNGGRVESLIACNSQG